MARPLDFIVFGVPRSGTRAFARGLSLHRDVFCARERFGARDDHREIRFPGSFLAPAAGADRVARDKAERETAEIRERAGVAFAGNKSPRYYLALGRINDEVPGLRNLWIYRSPKTFMQSWNRREADHARNRWRAGQIGLYGVLELVLCLDRCLALQKDAFIFPYDSGLNRSDAPLREALAFLGADPALLPGERFADDILMPRSDDPQRLPLAAYEADLLDAIAIDRLDALLETPRGVRLSEVRDGLAAYRATLADTFPAAFDRALAASGSRAAALYGADFFARNRDMLGPLIDLLRGTEAGTELLRFGPLKRVAALYAQRAALRRRFAG